MEKKKKRKHYIVSLSIESLSENMWVPSGLALLSLLLLFCLFTEEVEHNDAIGKVLPAVNLCLLQHVIGIDLIHMIVQYLFASTCNWPFLELASYVYVLNKCRGISGV
jgi:hypothetical protein